MKRIKMSNFREQIEEDIHLTLCSKKSPTSKVGDELRPHHT